MFLWELKFNFTTRILNSTSAIYRFISQQNKCCYDTLCFDSEVFNLTATACLCVQNMLGHGVKVALSSNLTEKTMAFKGKVH